MNEKNEKTPLNLYVKLSNIQQSLICKKGHWNTFSNFSYRTTEDILEALKPLLKKEKIIMKLDDDVVCIGDRNYQKATVKIIDMETGTAIVTHALACEPITKKGMDSAQISGTSSSYAHKRALGNLFMIDDSVDNDDDSSTDEFREQEELKTEPIDGIKLKTIKEKMIKKGVKDLAVLKRYQLDSLEKITNALYLSIMQALDNTPDKNPEGFSE